MRCLNMFVERLSRWRNGIGQEDLIELHHLELDNRHLGFDPVFEDSPRYSTSLIGVHRCTELFATRLQSILLLLQYGQHWPVVTRQTEANRMPVHCDLEAEGS